MVANYLKNSRILIVDDTAANVEVLESLLLMEGYENILSTTDSREVLELYLKFEPDLILLDLMMPFMSGFEVMEQLVRLVNEQIYLPILVLTADASDAIKKKALSAGASDFISKPFDLVEVSLRIKNLLYTNHLYSQIRNQNIRLEEKVKERTLELESKNELLKVALEKADSANRLKLAFLNNISHEIRTPLNGILGFRHLLSDNSVSIDEKIEYLEIMQESSTRLINTITSFLDISLLNSGNIEIILTNINPEIFVLDTFDKYQSDCIKKNIDFEINIENLPERIVVFSDENMLRKVFDNLVENAIKFTSKGRIEIGGEIVNNEIMFFVKDTGIGISHEFKNKIFQSFNQADEEINREFEGLGLGLSISKGLIDLLGGKIWYNSIQNKGTEFYFSIPVNVNEILSAKKELDLSGIDESEKPKILIVEDDETNYYLLYFFLSNSNVTLIRARDGIEALNLFKENQDTAIVLMDLKLPHLNGFRVTEEIKSINSQIPIIAISSYSGMEQRQMAFHAGCDDFIVKPVNKHVLFDKLSKYISIQPI
jgi:two-component system, sensor histidine kinase and response regulator